MFELWEIEGKEEKVNIPTLHAKLQQVILK